MQKSSPNRVGLEVPHAHIHLIPINSEADVNFRNHITIADEEQKAIAARIYAAFQKL